MSRAGPNFMHIGVQIDISKPLSGVVRCFNLKEKLAGIPSNMKNYRNFAIGV